MASAFSRLPSGVRSRRQTELFRSGVYCPYRGNPETVTWAPMGGGRELSAGVVRMICPSPDRRKNCPLVTAVTSPRIFRRWMLLQSSRSGTANGSAGAGSRTSMPVSVSALK